MSFIVCQIEPLKDDLIGIHHVRLLALGGENGVLARHLPAIAQRDDGNWSLSARELLQLENPEIQDESCILFDLTPHVQERKNLLRLVDVCGRTMSMVTDALFHFKVLAPAEPLVGSAPGFFTANHWRNGVDCYEQMRLEGGFLGGSWSWTEPPQPIGATVLHPFSS